MVARCWTENDQRSSMIRQPPFALIFRGERKDILFDVLGKRIASFTWFFGLPDAFVILLRGVFSPASLVVLLSLTDDGLGR